VSHNLPHSASARIVVLASGNLLDLRILRNWAGRQSMIETCRQCVGYWEGSRKVRKGIGSCSRKLERHCVDLARMDWLRLRCAEFRQRTRDRDPVVLDE